MQQARDEDLLEEVRKRLAGLFFEGAKHRLRQIAHGVQAVRVFQVRHQSQHLRLDPPCHCRIDRICEFGFRKVKARRELRSAFVKVDEASFEFSPGQGCNDFVSCFLSALVDL